LPTKNFRRIEAKKKIEEKQIFKVEETNYFITFALIDFFQVFDLSKKFENSFKNFFKSKSDQNLISSVDSL
jgi:uncharacterized protein YpuA (DUF1002 family)